MGGGLAQGDGAGARAGARDGGRAPGCVRGHGRALLRHAGRPHGRAGAQPLGGPGRLPPAQGLAARDGRLRDARRARRHPGVRPPLRLPHVRRAPGRALPRGPHAAQAVRACCYRLGVEEGT